jgi:pimeloyl-ACP methyl ester carboxylesterase
MTTSISLDQTFSHTDETHTYNIAYTTLGSPSNPPLIFIHGTPWSSVVWAPYATALSRSFHVHLFDNPGFGLSPLGKPLHSPSSPITPEIELDADLARQSAAFAALFHHWAKEWNGRKPHVVAHDHGGLMALRGFLLHDCLYASLCLIDVVAIGPFGHPLFKQVAEHRHVFEQVTGSVFEGIVESYIRDAAHIPLREKDMDMLKAPWLKDDQGRHGFVRQMCGANGRNTHEVEGRYAEVGQTMPVRIIWGKSDRWLPLEIAGRLGKKLGAESVVEIEDAGHLIMYDQPAALGVELGSWLMDVSKR